MAQQSGAHSHTESGERSWRMAQVIAGDHPKLTIAAPASAQGNSSVPPAHPALEG